jgi:hypothetical protein
MKELVKNPFVHLTYDETTSIVRMVRSAVPFRSAEELRNGLQPVPAALDTLGRDGKYLLVDTRLAIARDDAEFEVALRPMRARITRNFERVAVLTQTVIGQLQVQRQARESGEQAFVFTSEEEATAYLREGVDSRRMGPRSKR